MPPASDPPPAQPGGSAARPAWLSQALTRLANAAAAPSGWRGALLTIGLGVLAATAMPPIHFFPGLLAFAALAWRLETRISLPRAAATGWLFGFGYYVAGLYWISNALLVESDRFAWLIPLAAAGLPALLALFPALAMAVAPRLSRPGWSRALAVAVLWSVAEYARGHLFTGFPWNLPAYALSFSDNMSQSASSLGAYGLSLAVLLAAVGPAIGFGAAPRPKRFASTVAVTCLAIPLVLWASGAVRLWRADLDAGPGTGQNMDKSVVIRLVQGNIPQNLKWKPRLRAQHITHYMTLSRQAEATARAPGLPTDAEPTVIIWPETAVPALLAGDRTVREAIAGVAPPDGALVTGAPSMSEAAPRRLYNSLLALRPDGSIGARYDKTHLVPFGEYVPLRSWINLPRIAQSFTDFSPGPGPRTITVPGLGAVSPLICYEVIFPGAVIADNGGNRPRVLLNLTNDAWYGHSPGPFQHLAIAKMRAIEEGIPLIRAANTGVSGIYDAYGRTMVQLGLGATGVIDGYLPRAISANTVYARFGDTLYVIIVTVLLGGLVGLRLFSNDPAIDADSPNSG